MFYIFPCWRVTPALSVSRLQKDVDSRADNSVDYREDVEVLPENKHQRNWG